MKIKFDFLFEVVFEHEFFKKGIISELEIQPTQETRERLNNFGLLFKQTERGFVVLYEIDTADPAEPALRTITSEERFSFEVYMSQVYFTNYTNIPLNHKSPDFFYFNNLNENIIGSDLLLNTNSHVDSSDIIELASCIYNINQSAANPSSMLDVKDIKGTTVFSKTVFTQEGFMIVQIDFEKIGSGRYDIFIDGVLHKKVYTDKESSRKSLFGILEIFNSVQVPVSYRFASATGAVSKKKYQIRFARRNTTWKYFVILKNISSDPGLSISYGAKIAGEEIYPDTMIFGPGTPDINLVATYGAGKVLLFESADELPFYETPKANIKLLKPDSSDPDTEPDVVIEHLPNAPVSAIKTNTMNTETFSEIFIYV